MRSFLRIAFVFASVFLDAQQAFTQGSVDTLYRERVEYEDGKISVDFDQTPLRVALNAIQIKTGLQITVPPTTESKLLNLRLSGLPLEQRERSRNARLRADSKVDSSAEPVVEPLKAQERAQLQKELDRWSELRQEDRARIEERLRTLPPSEDREQLVREYGRQLLGIKN